ncbi:MAG: hypothetical protein JXA18_12000 [Chitinispirillaceae bacterium]|nr:hypothetical protein [Chitinispirillaceae bacterium]
MSLADPVVVVTKVTEALDTLGLPYMIGGSLASSLHGIPRATQDIDIVIDLKEPDIRPLENLLSPHFYFDTEMAKNAIRRCSSFNIIDKEEFFKIDIFIKKDDELSDEEMRRRKKHSLADAPGHSIHVCSPEDIVGHKLYWYKLGGGASERQWNDALNVLKVQGKSLDFDYLNRICASRGVLDLLHTIIAVSGSSFAPNNTWGRRPDENNCGKGGLRPK